jgi:pimeloyl-ACP methyl ester carboxylesterase
MADNYLELMKQCAAAAGVEPSEFVLPTDGYAELGGLRFHWLDWGNAHLPHVLLLHGGSLTAHTWDMAVLGLRHKYHFVALDQRGHGDTEWTPEQQFELDSSDLMLEDTRAFVDYLGWSGFALVGMSMGGINAIRYAARHSDAVAALGIVDVAPVSMGEGQREMADYREATDVLDNFEDFVDRSKKFMPHRAEAHLRYSLHHSLKPTADDRYTWKRDMRPRPSVVVSEEETARHTAQRWAEVAAIDVPTLLFRGANSKILSVGAASQMIETLRTGRLVTIERATHNVHSDNPVDFARELDGFLTPILSP